MREWFLKFLENHWAIVMLFVLFLLLGAAHSFIIHYNRPESVRTWCESMITGTFTAMIAKLKD